MKQTFKLFLHASPNAYDPNGTKPYTFAVWPCDMSSTNEIPLGAVEVEFDVPSSDQIVARHVVLLRAQLAKIRTEAEEKSNAILEQISKLEALTYTTPSSEAAP